MIARAPDGGVTTVKLLSENPEYYDDAAIAAIRRITGIIDGPLPYRQLQIGTTVATNALLERKGEPTLLAITRGFGHALCIGYQERPELFVREMIIAEPLYSSVTEIDERITADGTVLTALDEAKASTDLQATVGYARSLSFCSMVIAIPHMKQHL